MGDGAEMLRMANAALHDEIERLRGLIVEWAETDATDWYSLRQHSLDEFLAAAHRAADARDALRREARRLGDWERLPWADGSAEAAGTVALEAERG